MRYLPFLLLAACSGNLPSSSFIDKLRVLAVKAEPPEVAPNVTSALSALVVEPELQQQDGGPVSSVSYLWTACKIPDGATNLTPCGINSDGTVPSMALPPSCDSAPGSDFCVIGTDATASYTPTTAAIGSDGTGQWLVSLTVSDLPGGAIGCLTAAFASDGEPQNPDHCILAIKRLAVSVPGHLLSDGTTIPANTNPTLAGFLLDQPDGSTASIVDGQPVFFTQPDNNPATFTVHAVRADDSAEQYPTFDSDGKRTDVYEALALSWFITDGKMAAGRGAYNPVDCATQADCPTLLPVTEATVDWTPPTAADLAAHSPDRTVRFWAVLRDDRGGVSWLTGTAAAGN